MVLKPQKQWDKLPTSTGAGFQPSTVGNPYNGYIIISKPYYYWVDEFILNGSNWSLDPTTHDAVATWLKCLNQTRQKHQPATIETFFLCSMCFLCEPTFFKKVKAHVLRISGWKTHNNISAKTHVWPQNSRTCRLCRCYITVMCSSIPIPSLLVKSRNIILCNLECAEMHFVELPHPQEAAPVSGDSWMYPYQLTPMGNPY